MAQRTPEQMIKFWMNRCRRLEKTKNTGWDLASDRYKEINMLKDTLNQSFEVAKRAVKVLEKLSDNHTDNKKILEGIQKTYDDYWRKQDQVIPGVDLESEHLAQPDFDSVELNVSLNSEIMDLILDCGLYPAE